MRNASSRKCAWGLGALALPGFLALALGASAAPLDTHGLPRKFSRLPYALLSLTVGHPNDGFQLRAKRLTNTRELVVRPSSRDRSYGHPALVLMLRRSARDVATAVPGSVLFVGDLSAKGGGPLSGHHSHQSGRDADVGFYMTDVKGKPVRTRELVAFDGDGKSKDGSAVLFDDLRNWLLVESWVRDRRAGLSHIFVSDPLRARLLKFARSHPKHRAYVEPAMELLKQPENGEPHDDHFHVRISCPAELSDICVNESKT
jgi:penicillin-insensitive murein endopeptidase